MPDDPTADRVAGDPTDNDVHEVDNPRASFNNAPTPQPAHIVCASRCPVKGSPRRTRTSAEKDATSNAPTAAVAASNGCGRPYCSDAPAGTAPVAVASLAPDDPPPSGANGKPAATGGAPASIAAAKGRQASAPASDSPCATPASSSSPEDSTPPPAAAPAAESSLARKSVDSVASDDEAAETGAPASEEAGAGAGAPRASKTRFTSRLISPMQIAPPGRSKSNPLPRQRSGKRGSDETRRRQSSLKVIITKRKNSFSRRLSRYVGTNPLMADTMRNPMDDEDPERRGSVLGQIAGSMRRSTPRRIRESTFLLELFSADDLRGVILPFSHARSVWDLGVLVFVLYTAISLPIILAYDDAAVDFKRLSNFELVMDVFFMCDIVINFRTAYVKDAVLVVDKRRIARKYFTGWFPIDLVGSIPWEILFRLYELFAPSTSSSAANSTALAGQAQTGGQVENAEIVTLMRLLKTPKLLRIGRIFKFLEKIEGAANVGRIMLLMLLMAMIVHWISCVWFSVANLEDNGFLQLHGLDNLPWHQIYIDNFYTTLMMVMGDSTGPVTGVEKLFCSITVLVGATMNATIFANVASYVAMIGATSDQHKKRIEHVVRATRLLHMPVPTAERIRAYFDYCWLRHMDFAGQELVNELPVQLRQTVSLQTHGYKLRRLVLFANVDESFLGSLATYLQPEVFLPDEYILVKGQISNCAYFVERGRVQLIWVKEGKNARNEFVVRADYFGEHGLFQSKQHLYSARAMTHCDTYSLRRFDFEHVMREHPTVAVQIADMLPNVMPKATAKAAIEHIYELVGLREVLAIFTRGHGRWRPLKGLAAKIKKLANNQDFLARHNGVLNRLSHASTPRSANTSSQPSPPPGYSGVRGVPPQRPSPLGKCGGCMPPISSEMSSPCTEMMDTQGVSACESDGRLQPLHALRLPPDWDGPHGSMPSTSAFAPSAAHGPAVAARRNRASVSSCTSHPDVSMAPATLHPNAATEMSVAMLARSHDALSARVDDMATSQQRVEGLLARIANRLELEPEAGGFAPSAARSASAPAAEPPSEAPRPKRRAFGSVLGCISAPSSAQTPAAPDAPSRRTRGSVF